MILYPSLPRLFAPVLLHPSHLRKDPTTGHLLRDFFGNGHLVNECAECSFDIGSSYTATFSGITWGCCYALPFNTSATMVQDPNTTFALAYAGESGGQHLYQFTDTSNTWFRLYSAAGCTGSSSTFGLRVELKVQSFGNEAVLNIWPTTGAISGLRVFEGSIVVPGGCLMEEPTLEFATNACSTCNSNCIGQGGAAIATRNP